MPKNIKKSKSIGKNINKDLNLKRNKLSSSSSISKNKDNLNENNNRKNNTSKKYNNKKGMVEEITSLEKELKNYCKENFELRKKIIQKEALYSATKDELEDYENVILEIDKNYNILKEKYEKLLNSKKIK